MSGVLKIDIAETAEALKAVLEEQQGAPKRRSDKAILVFQPPYCPEVNPIERVWRALKRELAWVHVGDACQLQHAISQWVCRLSAESLRSLTQWDWIVNALCVAGIWRIDVSPVQ
ncbi:MAG TPA: transposase [Thermoleptolyngbya sp. M55_K2018_002]|nr:transposase [Thermoleptolyngbya sp. M55_K2018_002]